MILTHLSSSDMLGSLLGTYRLILFNSEPDDVKFIVPILQIWKLRDFEMKVVPTVILVICRLGLTQHHHISKAYNKIPVMYFKCTIN